MIPRRCFDMNELFLLSCAEMKEGGGIYKYGFSEHGQLKKIAYMPCDKPMYAVVNGDRLYILLRAPFENNDNSGFLSCKTDFSDVTSIGDTLGKCACHLAVDAEDSYIVNYLSGNIVKNCSLSRIHEGRGPNLPRQDMPHTHFTAFSPDKQYVLCCDLGLDTVFIYDRNLNEVSRAKVPDGYGVRHLVFSNDGHTVYAVNELFPSVSVFSFSGDRLSLKSTVTIPCKNQNSIAAAIRLSTDGKTLFVSVRGENAVFVFGVDGESLQLKTQFDCGGDSPRDIGLVGGYVVCTNENSNTVTVIEAKDYRIVENIRLPHPLCVLMTSE